MVLLGIFLITLYEGLKRSVGWVLQICNSSLEEEKTRIVGVISSFLPNGDIHWYLLWSILCGSCHRLLVVLLDLRLIFFSVGTLFGLVIESTYVTLNWPSCP